LNAFLGCNYLGETLANLTAWAPERVAALAWVLKNDLEDWSGELTSGEIFGVLFALKQLADQVGTC
jgi:hypothetical protein